MANNNISVAYTQLNEILKYIPTEDFKKIPIELIEKIRTNANKEYKFEYNPHESLENQGILQDTKSMISMLYREYWATEEEKNNIKIREQKQLLLNDLYARKKYNPDNLFKNKEEKYEEETTIENYQLLVKHNSLLERIIKMFKNLFKK